VIVFSIQQKLSDPHGGNCSLRQFTPTVEIVQGGWTPAVEIVRQNFLTPTVENEQKLFLTNRFVVSKKVTTETRRHDMDYISAYMQTEKYGQVEGCICVAEEGYGYWGFDDESGYWFEVVEEPDLILQEAIDEQGNVVFLTDLEKEKLLWIASEIYWERYAENNK
jgi:hypothetical protein